MFPFKKADYRIRIKRKWDFPFLYLHRLAFTDPNICIALDFKAQLDFMEEDPFFEIKF